MSQQVDVLKKSLEMVDSFLADREKELVTFKNFGIDTEPLEVLYKHFRELLQEMLAAPSPRAFHDMMTALSQSIAGVLIIVKPASADKVKRRMDKQGNMDPQAFEDMLKGMKANFDMNAETPDVNQNFDDEEFEDPNNDPEELLDALGLKDHVKKGAKKQKAPEPNEEEKQKDNDDPLQDVYDKF